MPAVAITGNIACGKSTVLKEFARFGKTIDCDAIVHKLYRKESLRKKLRETFGTASRKKLAEIVFKDKRMRKKLEALIHPLVKEELKKQIRANKGWLFAEVPLLFEASLTNLFDFVIVVKAKRRQQLERLLKSGYSIEEAKARINSQLALSKKIKNADFVIDNTEDIKRLKEQVLKIAKRLGCYEE